jgi:hypothetical protein
MRLGKLPQRLAADPLDDHTQQVVAGVAVQVFVPRREIEFLLSGQHLDHLIIGVKIFVARAGQLHQLDIVPQTTGMMNQASDRDRALVLG